VDLSGMEELFSQGLQFLDVSVLRLAFQDALHVHWSEPLDALPEQLTLQGLPEPGWSGVVYRELDGVLAEVEQNGVRYPVLGYKDIGAGRAWFVGLNLLYYSEVSHTPQLAQAIADLTLARSQVDRSLSYAAVPTESVQFGDGRLEFVYTADRAVEALVSFTYSPRWRAEVDGQPIPLREYQHLIRAALPAGRHDLRVYYDPYGTVWPRLGLLIGVISLGGLLAFVWVERLRWRRKQATLAQRMEDERREATRRANTTFSPCLNCGFRFSEVLPPTPATYPFNLISCPVCGQRLDGTGFRSGRAMTSEERQAALEKWLANRGHDPATVDARRDFGVGSFFEGEAVPPAEVKQT
jgi:hypothetical protein